MSSHAIPRRRFLSVLSSMGVSGGVFPGVLWAKVQDATEVTPEVIAEAEKVVGISFSPEERDLMVRRLRANRRSLEALRQLEIPDEVAPVFYFDPTPQGRSVPEGPSLLRPSEPRSLPGPESTHGHRLCFSWPTWRAAPRAIPVLGATHGALPGSAAPLRLGSQMCRDTY